MLPPLEPNLAAAVWDCNCVTWETLIGSENSPPVPSLERAGRDFLVGGGAAPEDPCFNELGCLESSECRKEDLVTPDFDPIDQMRNSRFFPPF